MGRMVFQDQAPFPSSRLMPWQALTCAAFALAVWGAKLWIIARFATPTPLADEWDSHAIKLFVPYSESTLSLHDLLSPHNEHRTLPTRLVVLGLYAANGAWDPILEMIVNAAIHVALGVTILLAFARHLERGAFTALAVVAATLLAVPDAPENPLWGIDGHFYAVRLFGFVALDLIAWDSGSLARWSSGVAAAVLAFLALASGALVFLAGAAVVAAKAWLGGAPRRRGWAMAGVLLAC